MAWALGTVARLDPRLRTAMEAEIWFRGQYGRASTGTEERNEAIENFTRPRPAPAPGGVGPVSPGIDPAAMWEEIRKWGRAVALKLHPDRRPGQEYAKEVYQEVAASCAELVARLDAAFPGTRNSG